MQAMVCQTPNLQDTQSAINNLCESNWLMLPLCSAGAFETQASQRKLHVVVSGVFSLAGVCMDSYVMPPWPMGRGSGCIVGWQVSICWVAACAVNCSIFVPRPQHTPCMYRKKISTHGT